MKCVPTVVILIPVNVILLHSSNMMVALNACICVHKAKWLTRCTSFLRHLYLYEISNKDKGIVSVVMSTEFPRLVLPDGKGDGRVTSLKTLYDWF